jgi:hypothetical protein
MMMNFRQCQMTKIAPIGNGIWMTVYGNARMEVQGITAIIFTVAGILRVSQIYTNTHHIITIKKVRILKEKVRSFIQAEDPVANRKDLLRKAAPVLEADRKALVGNFMGREILL